MIQEWYDAKNLEYFGKKKKKSKKQTTKPGETEMRINTARVADAW